MGQPIDLSLDPSLYTEQVEIASPEESGQRLTRLKAAPERAREAAPEASDPTGPDAPVDKVQAWETAFYQFMDANYPQIGKAIAESGAISAETEEALKKAITEYNQAPPI